MIKITTDSTCDLPSSLLEKYDITVIPLGIVKAGKLYRDGVDIRTADIAAHVDVGGEITTTNAVNAADYETVFREMTARYDAVIHLNIGMGFSSCYQNAKLAAEEVPEVYVVDSQNLSVGHGWLVLAAAEAAKDGKSVGEILSLLEDLTPRVEISFVLDRLDYMKKGGRCSAVTALGANLLKLHPCIEVISGRMGVTKKYRGSMEKVVADYVRGCSWWTAAVPPVSRRLPAGCWRSAAISTRSSRPRLAAPSSATAGRIPWAWCSCGNKHNLDLYGQYRAQKER